MQNELFSLQLWLYTLAALGIVISLVTQKPWALALTVIAGVWIYLHPEPVAPIETIDRTPPPALQRSNAEHEDRLSKPDSLQERDQRMKESVQRGLEFKPTEN